MLYWLSWRWIGYVDELKGESGESVGFNWVYAALIEGMCKIYNSAGTSCQSNEGWKEMSG